MGNRSEPDLQAGLRKSQPAHLAQPLGPFGRAEHLLNPATHPTDLGIVHPQPLFRCRPTKPARVHDACPAASGTDDPLGPVTLMGAVTIGVAGCIGQDGLEFVGVVPSPTLMAHRRVELHQDEPNQATRTRVSR